MKKPDLAFETRDWKARRLDAPDAAWAGEPRAESFELTSEAGGRARAHLSLHRQWLSAELAPDPQIEQAVGAWVFARGGRKLNLQVEGGGGTQREIDADALSQLASSRPLDRPMRVITLAPSNAEVMHALGAFELVIACEDSSDFPAAVEALPRLGPDLNPDLDRVASLGPDLVLSSLTVPGMERIVSGLRARGIPQLVLAPKTLAQIPEDLRRVGKAIDRDDAAQRAVVDFEAQRWALQEAKPEVPRRVYLEWWPRPMFSPGADCYSNELIELAGGTNVFREREGASLEVTAAELVQADPEICFVSWCGVKEAKLDPQRLIAREGLEPLLAAQAGQVHALDEAFAGRPGPRVLEAARRMAARIRDLA